MPPASVDQFGWRVRIAARRAAVAGYSAVVTETGADRRNFVRRYADGIRCAAARPVTLVPLEGLNRHKDRSRRN